MISSEILREAKAHFIASHQHPINQALHHFNNFLVLVGVGMLFVDWRYSPLCVLVAQAIAISGHALFEKNEPAFRQYPGIPTILASMSWSFENAFGLRQVVWRGRQKR